MSGSAKKRREKARHRLRRWCHRHTWYRVADDAFMPEPIGMAGLTPSEFARVRERVAQLAAEIKELS